MKVLLAVDGSPYTKRMLGWLAAHDEVFKSDVRYTVLTVVPELPRHAAFFELPDADTYYRELADEVLAPVRAFAAQKQWDATFVHRVGVPAEAIAAVAAEQDADLLVLGSHGHTALGNLVLGSVTTSVLARCQRPVLIVR